MTIDATERIHIRNKAQADNFDSGTVSLLNQQIAAHVAAQLTKRDRSQAWLARQVGVTPATIGRLLDAQLQWTPRYLEAVAAALGLRPRDLLPDDDAPSSADPSPARPNPAPVAPPPPETGAALAAAAGITEAELQLVMALRAPELRALLEAIGQLAHAANTDRKPPDDTRARLERLLEPNRMGRRPATRSPAVKPLK